MTISSPPALHVIAYHYVRDLERSRFPRLKAMASSDFRGQVEYLRTRCEMATLESTMAFVAGTYTPGRDLCLLTFDDGVSEHHDDVFPYLAERGIEGVFFLISSCLDGQVAPVHQNHFLMAELGFEEYQRRFLAALSWRNALPAVNTRRAQATYRWDTPEVAAFKYLLNFVLAEQSRNAVLDELFAGCLGESASFARDLYLSWSEAATMQRNGMVVGGHTATHPVLSRLTPEHQRLELATSTARIQGQLDAQPLWPFSYPFGKPHAFDSVTIGLLQELGFCCAFTTVPGENRPRAASYTLRRIDPKEAVTL